MEVHAVAGGWVLEWSGATSSSICKTTLSVAGLLVVAGTVVGTVKQHRHRQFVRSCQQRDDDDSKQEKTEDQNGAVEAGGVRVTRAMASEMTLVDKGGNSRANSRMARVGRGLESVGGVTESTFHRLTNVVGSVVKLPVVLMTKVGGFVSTQPASLPSSLQPVEDRVFQLEIQMKNLEDKYNSKTLTELSLSPRKEKPPLARSLLLDMDAEGASAERVQMLENRLNTRMESIEKAMSAIQDQLAMVNVKPATVVYQRQESMQHEEYHDAEQQSDNSEALESKIGETAETSFGSTAKAVEELDVEKSGDVREPHSVAALGSAESVESDNIKAPGEASGASSASTTEAVEKLDTIKSGDFLKPQLVAEIVERSDEDVGTSPVSAKGQQLAATLEELHEGFVTEPSTAAAAERFVEIARADNAEESSMAPSPSESHESLLGEPREVFSNANSDEAAQEDIDSAIKSSLASTVEDAREDHVKEPMAAAPVQELAAGEESNTALISVEPQVASKHLELPSAGFEELSQEDRGIVAPAAEFSSEESHVKERALQEDSGAKPQMMTEIFEELSETEPSASFEEPGAVANLPSSVSSEEAQEEFAKDPLAVAEFPQAPVAEEVDDWALASHDPKDVEEPSAPLESVNLKEHAPEDATDESGSMIEESLLSSSKESEEDVTESLAGASSIEPATEEDVGSERSDMTHASAPLDGANLKESEEDVEESSAGAPSIKPVTEEDSSDDKDLALASSEPEHVQDPGQSAKLKGHAPEDATDESGSMIKEPPSSSSKESQGDVESSAGAPSVEPATDEDPGGSSDPAFAFALKDGAGVKESQEDVEESSAGAPSIKPETKEDPSEGKDLALASSEPEHVKDPVQSVDLKEHAPEDATDESGSIVEESHLSSSKNSQEDVTESSAGASSMEPAIEEDLGSERSDMTLAFAPRDGADEKESEKVLEESSAGAPSSKPATEEVSSECSGMTLASSHVKEPSAHVESVDLKEHAPENATDESGSMLEESPLSSSKKTQEDVTESSAGASSNEPAAENDLGETSDMAEPQVASKDVELPSAGSEELADEDVAHKSNIIVDSSAGVSHEDAVKELSSERAPHEESGMALEPQFVEEPSAHVESADLKEHAPEDATDESGTMIEESPFSSSKKTQEDVTESKAGASSIEPAAEEDLGETSDMAEPQVASKHVELSSAGSEEIPHKDVAYKNGIAAESSPEESVKELSAERAPEEDSGMALAPSEPSAHVESADVGENAPEDATDESGTMIEESPLSPSKKSQDDVTESKAGASSIEPAAEENPVEGSDMALTSAEPQVAPKHVEISSAQEVPHEDVAHKISIAAGSSSEENQEDRVKELSAERASQEESGMALAPSDPQCVEEPSAHVQSADLGEHAPEDAINQSGSMVEEAPLSSSKISQEDAKEFSAGAPIVEPATEDLGRSDDMAEPQVAPKFVEEVPSASGDSQELATQKDGADEGGTMLAAVAESPSEEVQEAVVKEDPEDFGEMGETTLASRGMQVPSSFVEKPSAANSEESDADAPESKLPVREALATEPQAGGDGTSLDAQSKSNLDAPSDELVQGSSEAGVNREEPAQENTGIVHLAPRSPLLASKAEEAQEDSEQGQTEAEHGVAVDEQVESTEESSPRSQSTSAPAGSDELKPDTLESESSGQVFFDADQSLDDEIAFEPEEQPAQEPENEGAHVPEQRAQEPAQEPELAQVLVHQPSEESARETEHQPAQEREYQPQQVPEYEPSRERAQEPEEGSTHVPEQLPAQVPRHEQLPAQVPGQELAQLPEHQPAQEPDEPARETEYQPAQEREYQPEKEPAKERAQEPEQELSNFPVHQPAQETDSKSAEDLAQIPAEEPEHRPEQDVAQPSERDPAQDDLIGIAPPSSEPQAASSSEEHQEQLAEHPLAGAPSDNFEEPAQEFAQENLGGKSAHPAEERGEAPAFYPIAQEMSVDEPSVVAPRVEPAQEREAEPAQRLEAEPAQKLQAEPVQDPEAEPARVPGVEPARVPGVEPARQPEVEPARQPESKPAQEREAEPARQPEVELAREFEGEPARQREEEPAREPEEEPTRVPEAEPAREPEGELARGPEVEPVREAGAEPVREPEGEPVRAPEAEPAQEREAEPAQERETEPAQEREAETAQEPEGKPAREPESEPAQEHEAEPVEEEEEFHDTNDGSAPLEPVKTVEQKSLDGTSVAAGTSSTPLVAGHDDAGTSDHHNESSNPQVGHILEAAETAQVGDHDASSEVQPTSSLQELFLKESLAAEEPIASSASKSVKFADEPSVVEPKSELAEGSVIDTSTIALQAPLTAITEGQQQHDPLTPIVEEDQQQQYEADHDSAGTQIPAEHKGAAEAPKIQIPDAQPASQQTETAKDKHARRKGFSRSSSEPKFDYHLHDNRKAVSIQDSALVPTSSTAHQESTLVPTSSTAYQDDVDWDVQCLPFRMMSHGEGRPRRESESKSVEDVQSPTTPTNVALEPKLSRRLEKKKEKERRHSFRMEAKQEKEKDKESRRHSLNLNVIDRKGSLASAAEESDAGTPRADDVVVKHHKGPFKHLRNRLRHAFSVNKDVTP